MNETWNSLTLAYVENFSGVRNVDSSKQNHFLSIILGDVHLDISIWCLIIQVSHKGKINKTGRRFMNEIQGYMRTTRHYNTASPQHSSLPSHTSFLETYAKSRVTDVMFWKCYLNCNVNKVFFCLLNAFHSLSSGGKSFNNNERENSHIFIDHDRRH